MSTDLEPLCVAYHTDATVQQMFDAGATPEDIIAALVKEKHDLAEKCLRYESIAPPTFIPRQSA